MGGKGLDWKAVALGWIIATPVGAVLGLVLRFLYGLAVGAPVGQGSVTASAAVLALAAGFPAYLVGGFAAGRRAGTSGGSNGAMSAVIGLVAGVVLTAALSGFGALFVEGVALPPSAFGFGKAGLFAGLIVFLINLFGGYVGGKLGELPPGSERYRGEEFCEPRR